MTHKVLPVKGIRMSCPGVISVLVSEASTFGAELLGRALRRGGFEVTACVATAEELFRNIRERMPDEALVSVSLGGIRLGGFRVLRELTISHPSVRVILLADEVIARW